MIEFILNNEKISTNKLTGSLLLDFVRYNKSLTGTKIGCREGDCGACTVLIGDLVNNQMKYQQVTSCLTPIANIHGKHVATVEGLNMDDLSPVQKYMVEEAGTQCGFCTVGFVVSLTGFCLANANPTYQEAIALFEQIGSPAGLLRTQRHYTQLLAQQGRIDEARRLDFAFRGHSFLARSLDGCLACPAPTMTSNLLHDLGLRKLHNETRLTVTWLASRWKRR